MLFLKKNSKHILNLMLLALIFYGAGRLYFQLTAGFTEGNIKTDLSLEPDWKIPPLSLEAHQHIEKMMDQPFHYLGKGCQSYVFLSEDKKHVIKFLKYQRFRPQSYLEVLSFIPSVEAQRVKKSLEKRKKLDALLESWKIAYSDLKEESGIEYLHLNQGDHFSKPLVIIDKLGWRHEINPDEVAFLIQKKADMLCSTIAHNDTDANRRLIDRLLSMLLSEYARGLGDNDHALMQNTGVDQGQPLHIDVGQFSKEERFKDPQVYKLELFSKTYKFRIWLSKRYPELERYLTSLLLEVIGPEMAEMKTQFKTVDEGG